MRESRVRWLAVLVLLSIPGAVMAQSGPPVAFAGCGEVVTIATHAGSTTRYAFVPGLRAPARETPIAMVMLVGGSGYLDLDDTGCPRLLNRNSLLRMRPLLHAAGIASALVDAPSDRRTDEGLGGFRIAAAHADDLGKVIADVRARNGGAVWVLGHSRGTISAVNAAARLAGPSAADGVVLISAMMAGNNKGRPSWVAQTVFSVDLGAIQVPLLVVGHAADSCVRSPSALMGDITAKTHAARRQVAEVSGGPFDPGRPASVTACDVRQPHDFVDQESELAAGILRFVRGGSY
jgi:pimeloyl-ACP methyl ester carboxylesterase